MGITVYTSTVEALSRIRTGALLMIIASLISGISSLVVPTIPLPRFFGFRDIYSLITHLLTSLAISLALGFIAFVLVLVAIYAMLVPGAKKLAQANPGYSTASKLMSVGYVWGVVVSVIALVMIVVGVIMLLPWLAAGGYIGGLGVFALLGISGLLGLVGLVLLIIGFVGFLVLVFRLYDLEKNILYLVAGVLFIVGTVVPMVFSIALMPMRITTFAHTVLLLIAWIPIPIAWVLMYVALGQSIEGYKSQTRQPIAPI